MITIVFIALAITSSMPHNVALPFMPPNVRMNEESWIRVHFLASTMFWIGAIVTAIWGT